MTSTKPDVSPLPRLYSVWEVARILGVSTKSVRRWIASGDLVAHRFGRQIRISEPDLDSFVKVHRQS